jgi:PleD family two-component response regulator
MEWVCGTYTIQGKAGPKKLSVSASVGLAEHLPGETMNELLARADAEMYQHKAASRAIRNSAKR